jgi:hypothetical protein
MAASSAAGDWNLCAELLVRHAPSRWSLRAAVNWVNLSTLLGLLIAVAGRAMLSRALDRLLCGLSIYMQTRYPETLKRWTRRRIIDTTAVIVLGAALVLGGFMLMTPDRPVVWTLPVTGLVIVATLPFSFARLVREAVRDPQAARRAANARDHGTGAKT